MLHVLQPIWFSSPLINRKNKFFRTPKGSFLPQIKLFVPQIGCFFTPKFFYTNNHVKIYILNIVSPTLSRTDRPGDGTANGAGTVPVCKSVINRFFGANFCDYFYKFWLIYMLLTIYKLRQSIKCLGKLSF